MEHAAAYWSAESEGFVRCALCPQRCAIAPGRVGRCGARLNRDGRLVARGWGVVAAEHLDPIEKKPLWHFHPGRQILSLGGWGCNLGCRYCQNWSLSGGFVAGAVTEPEEVVAAARAIEGNLGVAFTYNEPLIHFEWVLACARLLRESGLRTVLVTNGFLEPEPLAELLPWVDAANVDLKSLDEGFYRRLCGGALAPVLASLPHFRRHTHLEVTKLLVTGHVDPVEDAAEVAAWIARELSPEVPLHLTRYFPQHDWSSPATEPEALREAVRRARESLRYVYAGNVAGEDEDTRCLDCGHLLIERIGYRAHAVGVEPGGTCGGCGRSVPIVAF